MLIDNLIDANAELTHGNASKCPVVLSTRVRLARNLTGHFLPGWAKESQRRDILSESLKTIPTLPLLKGGIAARVEDLGDLEKQILFERHLISRELMGNKHNCGVVISKDQSCIVMINEEDHFRIQYLRSGFHFKKVWKAIDALDTELEENFDFAFSPTLGYLTACPTNLGTGMRASAMMHLPALVISNQMEKVIRAVNQLGLAVRGLFGEGSDASGSIFQISNQYTLGESEEDIIKRLTNVLHTVIDQETNARERLLEKEETRIFDKIGRAYGILQNGHLISSSEAMNLLSLIRLGVDLQIFPEQHRVSIDRLLIETQPGHVQYSSKGEAESDKRDLLRARILQEEFANIAKPDFSLLRN